MAEFQNTLDRMLSSVAGEQAPTLAPGSKLHQIAQGIAYEKYQLELKNEKKYAKASLLSATGTDLDDIGTNIFGIRRLDAVRPEISDAMKIAKFFVNVGTFGDLNKDPYGTPRDITIPPGTIVYGTYQGTTYSFSIQSQMVLEKNKSEAYFSAVMSSGDNTMIPTGTLVKHNFTSYTQGMNSTLSVTNPYPIMTGREIESDADYRSRIMMALRAVVPTSYYGIMNIVRGIPGVANVIMESSDAGGGSFKVIVQGVTPTSSDAILEQARTAISEVVPPWIKFSVVRPNYIGLSMMLTITLRDGYTNSQEAIKDNIVKELSTTINNWEGGAFYAEYIPSIVYAAGGQDVIDVTINTLKSYQGSGSYRDTNVLGSTAIISLGQNEKLIVEPINNAINVFFAG